MFAYVYMRVCVCVCVCVCLRIESLQQSIILKDLPNSTRKLAAGMTEPFLLINYRVKRSFDL